MPILTQYLVSYCCVYFLHCNCHVKSAISNVTDKSVDKETLEKYRETILSVDGVLGIDEFRTRIFGPRVL